MFVQDLQIDKRVAGIYKFTFPNGKVYIGKSVNLYKRFIIHKSDINRKDFLLYRAFRKYGWDNVTKEIIVSYDTTQYTDIVGLNNTLTELEVKYIALYNSNDSKYGYNCTIGGEGTSGHHLSESARRRISKARVGRKASDETKKKMSATRKGRKHSYETILKFKALKRAPSKKAVELLKQSNIKREIPIEVLKDGEPIAVFKSISLASKFINSCKSDICKCLKGKAKTVKGFTFRYLDRREEEHWH